VILSPDGAEIPPELSGCTVVLTIRRRTGGDPALLRNAIDRLPKVRDGAAPNGASMPPSMLPWVSRRTSGKLLCETLVTLRRVDPLAVAKRRGVVAQDGLLEWLTRTARSRSPRRQRFCEGLADAAEGSVLAACSRVRDRRRVGCS
jgi:hypothetical protein